MDMIFNISQIRTNNLHEYTFSYINPCIFIVKPHSILLHVYTMHATVGRDCIVGWIEFNRPWGSPVFEVWDACMICMTACGSCAWIRPTLLVEVAACLLVHELRHNTGKPAFSFLLSPFLQWNFACMLVQPLRQYCSDGVLFRMALIDRVDVGKVYRV